MQPVSPVEPRFTKTELRAKALHALEEALAQASIQAAYKPRLVAFPLAFLANAEELRKPFDQFYAAIQLIDTEARIKHATHALRMIYYLLRMNRPLDLSPQPADNCLQRSQGSGERRAREQAEARAELDRLIGK